MFFRHESTFGLTVLLFIVSGVHAVEAETTIDFEGLAAIEGTVVDTPISGVGFENAYFALYGAPFFAFWGPGPVYDIGLTEPFSNVGNTFITSLSQVLTLDFTSYPLGVRDLSFAVCDLEVNNGRPETLLVQAFASDGVSLLDTVVISPPSPDTGNGVTTPVNLGDTKGIHYVTLEVEAGWGLDDITFTPEPFPGDANSDGHVDGNDYVIWAAGFNQFDGNALPSNGDFNEDGYVDGLDYIAWASNYGAGPNDAVAVPEPKTMLISLMAISTLLLSRKFEVATVA